MDTAAMEIALPDKFREPLLGTFAIPLADKPHPPLQPPPAHLITEAASNAVSEKTLPIGRKMPRITNNDKGPRRGPRRVAQQQQEGLPPSLLMKFLDPLEEFHVTWNVIFPDFYMKIIDVPLI